MSRLDDKRFKVYSFYIAIILIISLIALLFFYNGGLTGRVVSENCTEVERCENITTEQCDENCTEVCNPVTSIECSMQDSEECKEVCVEEGNDTVCSDECTPIQIEVCENITDEVCENICEKTDCKDVVTENCSIEEVCVPIEEKATEEPTNESTGSDASTSTDTQTEDNQSSGTTDSTQTTETTTTEENITESPSENVSKEITIEEFLITNEELFNFKARTGTSEVVSFNEGSSNGFIKIRFVAGDYWVEKNYDSSLSSQTLDLLIAQDKNRLIKKIGGGRL